MLVRKSTHDARHRWRRAKKKQLVAIVNGTADVIHASGDSSGPFATEDLSFADELSAISMTNDGHQQIFEEPKVF